MYEQALTIYSLKVVLCKGHKNLRTYRHLPPAFHPSSQVPVTSQVCQATILQRGYSKSQQTLVPKQTLIILIFPSFSISMSGKFLAVTKAVDEMH